MLKIRMHCRVQEKGVLAAVPCNVRKANKLFIVERDNIAETMAENSRKIPDAVFLPTGGKQGVQRLIVHWMIVVKSHHDANAIGMRSDELR
jgi:hypothetical protein